MNPGRHGVSREPQRRRARVALARRCIPTTWAAVFFVFALTTGVAWAYWGASSSPGGNGASAATTVDQGSTPTADAAGDEVTVGWAASTLSNGDAVSGYVVKRYSSGTLIPQTILSACAGTVAALSCVESSVPAGAWVYSVTPVFATSWRGAESLSSSTIWVDITAPVNSITSTAVSGSSVKSGNTIYYRGAALGSFTLTNAVSDSGSGPASSETSTLGGTSTGWTHSPSTVSAPAGGPYVSTVFSWTAGTTTSPTEVVTGKDVANNSAATTLTFTNDSTGPTGGSVDADGLVGTGSRYSASTTLSINLAKGTDTAGVATTGNQLLRATATLTSGTCGSYGSYALITGGTDPVSPKSDTVTDQACYRYQYLVADTLGSSTTYTSPDIKVDTTAPAAPSMSYGTFTNTYWSGAGSTVFYRSAAASGSFTATASATDAASGIASYGFPALGTNWTSTPGSLGVNTYSWSGAPAAPGTKSVTATNNADGTSAGTSFTLTADDTAPTAGTVTYFNGTQSGTTISVTFTTGTDAGSGIGTRLLQRASATLTGSTCGSYGAFGTVANGTNPTSPLDDTVTAGNCYQYQYVVADNVGNTHTATSASVTKVSPAVCATPGVQATVLSTADATLQQASPDANFGTGPDMFVNPTSGASMRSVVKFTLPTLGAGCTVTAATLRLNNHGSTGRSIDVYLADRSWTEASVTWNKVSYTGTAANSTAVTGWQEWAVTAHVISQYTTNNGFVVRDHLDTGSPQEAYYTRSEGANAPQLIVTWG
jgi:hypothetical protein